ncbi:hypothetical protein CK203_060870 [Vitis vinifera]|uniref:Uncharacterized protein n=1 Tax=Vitis vinifera TaxID=29760 RepID=A0A438FUE1_VITVI|nr:hypothetical protein CK203_060870 [Vitis vinifera]
MPELMLVVSAELKNVVILQPQDGIDNETINYYFKCQGCERHDAILLIPGHGAPLS